MILLEKDWKEGALIPLHETQKILKPTTKTKKALFKLLYAYILFHGFIIILGNFSIEIKKEMNIFSFQSILAERSAGEISPHSALISLILKYICLKNL